MGNPNVQTADLLDLQAEEKSVHSFDPFFGLDAKDSPRLAAAALPPVLPPPPAGTTTFSKAVKLNSTFPEKFSEPTASRFSPLMPPPTKTAKPKSDSISHYSTIRPRKKSAKDELSSLSSFNQSFPDEGKSLNSSFDTQESLNSFFKSNISSKGPSPLPEPVSARKDKFDCEPFIAKAPVDLFTELDPLNAGSSRPFVDKQFFFQDLKKPTSISVELPAPKEVQRSLSGSQAVNYQPVADFQASLFDAPFTFEEPKKDPFDTNFVSSVCSAMSCQPEATFPAFSSLSYENSKAITEARNESFHSDFSSLGSVHHSLNTPETVKKKNVSPAPSFVHSVQKQEVCFDDNAPAKVPLKDSASPATPRRFSDSSSSDEAADFHAFRDDTWEQKNGHADVVAPARVSSPPQPPPRPPILRPPPLPPKGQPPNIPQRTVVVEEAGTPPLPVPMRKAKNAVPVKPTLQRVVSRPPDDVKRRPASPKQPDINNISLIQLSNMSLADLAATLKLPPVRVASMTLTELALRLNELNREPKKEADKYEDDETKDFVPKRSKRLSERSLDEMEDERDFEEEFEEDEDDDDEEEQEASETKAEDTEICYKGGKKYEMLSDVEGHEEELDIGTKKLADDSARPKCESTTSNTSESDRYAALREIMEQDLASNRSFQEATIPSFDGDKFADFDSFKETQVEEAIQAEPSLGFEDDFSNLSVRFPQADAEPNATSTPEVTEVKAVFEDNFEADFNEAMKASKEDLFNESETENDDLAKKFAAFEARFPLNPGFADSFVEAEHSVNDAKTMQKSDSFDVDFDSAFQESQAQEPAAYQETHSSKIIVKKSTSVNIFKRVDDPFDDDFFQSTPDVTPAKPSSTKVFATIVEDPFVWVQPFDDDAAFEDSPAFS